MKYIKFGVEYGAPPFFNTDVDKMGHIDFDEMDADFETPVLLLQERNKIRLIHGEKRMALSQVEHAYPYLLLNRQQGINWQTIQHVIQQLTPPIQVTQLYTALMAHIQE